MSISLFETFDFPPYMVMFTYLQKGSCTKNGRVRMFTDRPRKGSLQVVGRVEDVFSKVLEASRLF